MNSIGGYFELDLRNGEEFHSNAIGLNTGRNALELILKVKKFEKLFIPYYTCDAILEPLKKLKIDYEFYYINKKFEPLFNFNLLKEQESFLYTNYFGMKDTLISVLSKKCKNLIIDNSQAFFALPKYGIPTFYSCRKFFGVPDGAYLYLEGDYKFAFPKDYSSDRFKHLTKRIELGAEAGYFDFKACEKNLIGQPIKMMSKLTHCLLRNIDYNLVQKKRKENFLFLHEKLSKNNELEIDNIEDFIPMVYPLLINRSGLINKLIKNKIYTPSYWPNVTKWTEPTSIEYYLSQNLINIPIDQRYDINSMKFIVNEITQ